MPAPDDSRFEWIHVPEAGNEDQWVRGRCRHLTPIPVRARPTGELVAWLCPDCDAQLSNSSVPGIAAGDAVQVTPLSTPGSGVSVADGFRTVSVGIGPTGHRGRSDMLIVRAQGAEREGALEVIPDVPPNAATVPGGRSGIPLARIDVPRYADTITSAMIVRLQKPQDCSAVSS